MIVLSLRTDKPKAKLGVYEGSGQLAYESWQAHRELAETIHDKLSEILNKSSISLKDIEGIVVYKGPGSFTGLRIGLSVANVLAYSLEVPIVATGGADWIKDGVRKLSDGQDDKIALPKYGAQAHTTQPKK